MKKPGARHWLGLIVLALPALLFVPGIGFESSHPAALARRSGVPGSWFYRVRGGDSLTTIAERELGTFKRFKEILALNPGIKPRSLQLGEVLRMPPRAPDARRSTPPASDAAQDDPPDAHRLLLSLAGLLALVVVIVLLAGRFERGRPTRA